jgi:hypothetical protein
LSWLSPVLELLHSQRNATVPATPQVLANGGQLLVSLAKIAPKVNTALVVPLLRSALLALLGTKEGMVLYTRPVFRPMTPARPVQEDFSSISKAK